MKAIQDYIDRKQQEFTNHPFFPLLEKMKTLDEIGYFVPDLTFWVMAFQDILRLNEERVVDPYLKKIAHHHKFEDAGHEQWFLYDKNHICGKHSSTSEDVNWLFGRETHLTRDPTYALVSEVYRSENDWLRIALLVTIESSGHVFFDKIVNKMQELGENDNLKYFARSHLDVELAHDLFEEEMERQLYAEPLPPDIRAGALKLVDRCYDAFGRMFDGLIAAYEREVELAQKRDLQNAAAVVDYAAHNAV
jgi:hypothetical protein